MTKHHENDQTTVQTAAQSRRTRLQSLLFTGAALGTTLLMFAAADPKFPRFVGE